MSTQDFLTVAGRWRQHVAASGLDSALPRRELALAMMMFYAGFGAALDASLEVADFDELEAVHLLHALRIEIEQVAAIATRSLGGAQPS